jgi:hypothetical protein
MVLGLSEISEPVRTRPNLVSGVSAEYLKSSFRTAQPCNMDKQKQEGYCFYLRLISTDVQV